MENVTTVVQQHQTNEPAPNKEAENLPTNSPQPTEPVQANEPKETETPTSDLMKRVSEFTTKTSPEHKSEAEIDRDFFSDPELRKKISSIQDSELRSQFEQLRRSIITGGNQKFQDLAELRSKMESLENQVRSSDNGFYDVERQIKDPKWLERAAKVDAAIGESLADEGPLSDIDEGTRQVIEELRSEIAQLKSQNMKTVTQQQRQYQQAEHSRLQSSYSNYNPQEVDTVTYEMLQGKRTSVNPGSSIFEDMYKAMKHDENVKNAYKLGRQDERNGRVDAPPSIDGITTQPAQTIEAEKGESSQSFLSRIISKNLAAAKTKTTI